MADQDIEQAADGALPEPIEFDPSNPPGELPPLPPGFRWEVKVTAEADVIHPDGSVN